MIKTKKENDGIDCKKGGLKIIERGDFEATAQRFRSSAINQRSTD